MVSAAAVACSLPLRGRVLRGHGDRRGLLRNRDNHDRDHGREIRDSREPRDCREEPGGQNESWFTWRLICSGTTHGNVKLQRCTKG